MKLEKNKNSIIPFQAKKAISIFSREIANSYSNLILTGRKGNIWGKIQLIFTDVYMEMKFKIKRRE